MLYYEDMEIGRHWEFGPYRLTETEIVEFAEKYDPQPMHVDADAAEESPFGGLIASGPHLIAIVSRLLVDHFYSDAANVGGLGMDDLRFRRPGRPGDELSLRQEVADRRPSESHPDRGIVHLDRSLYDQDDRQVLSMTGVSLFDRRK